MEADDEALLWAGAPPVVEADDEALLWAGAPPVVEADVRPCCGLERLPLWRLM